MRKLLTIMLLAAATMPALSQAQTTNICDRTPQVRDEILLAIGADDCAAVSSGGWRGLANIGRLDLEQKQITTLQAGDFAGLTNLQSLDLQINQLTTLPAGVFDDLTSLQVLYLSNNRLTALPDDLFDGLTSLQILLLGDNHLVGLTQNDPLFAGLPRGVDLQLIGQTVATLETRMAALEASITALAEAVATQQTTLEAAMAAQRETLEASITLLQETLEQRLGDLEAAGVDAPPSRLLIVPLNQAREQQEKPQ